MIETALLIASLFAIGLYLMMKSNLLNILLGLTVLSNAVNLFILVMSGDPTSKSAPIVDGLDQMRVDPLPQALILTAIVIGFGITAYLVSYVNRVYQEEKTIDLKSIYESKDQP